MFFHDGSVRRLLSIQTILVALAVATFLVLGSPPAAASALYGGVIALLSATLLGHGVQRAAETAQAAPEIGMRALYFGAVLRFVLVLVLFGVGMGLLRLAPLPLIAGFAVAQLAFLINGLGAALSKTASHAGAGK